MRKSIIQTKNIYHHLGIYCYQVETLKNFVSLDQSQNETKYKLEQLRALDNNININVCSCKQFTHRTRYKGRFYSYKKNYGI